MTTDKTTTGHVAKQTFSRLSTWGKTPGGSQLKNNPAETQFEAPPPAICRPLVIFKTRAATPKDSDDKFIELCAQSDLVWKAQRNTEVARLRREIEERQAELETMVKQAPKNIESNDPCIAFFRKNYPAINTLYFKQILENKFNPLNIAKLCPDIIFTQPSKHTISLGKSIEVETGKKNAAAEDIKGSNYLARCIMVYFAAKIHFAEPASKEPLWQAFLFYLDRLFSHQSMYTWELIRIFHLTFHKTCICEKVNNLMR